MKSMKQNNSLITDNNLKKGQIEMKGYIDEYNKDNKIEFTATAKAIFIDWGDGTVEKFAPNDLESTFTHIYNNKVDCYTITVETEDMIELNCCGNLLTSLNMSGCSVLTRLDCSFNELTSLNVSGCTALTTLYCYNNQLTLLDVSGCIAFTELICSNNLLTSLDVSGLTALTRLYCGNNRLTLLDVSRNNALTELHCSGNEITSLDVSKNTSLTTLYCNDNKLTSLDLSGLVALSTLECSNNYQLTAEALSSIFETLPITTEGVITTSNKPPALIEDIAINKGWKLIYKSY